MPGRTVQFEGRSFAFPDDATDDEISQVLASASGQPRPNDPNSIISGPEPGLGGSINRLSAKVKGWLGGNKPERGSGSGAVDLLGGPALGPLKMAHGTTQLTTHPVKGLNEIVRGGVQTAALPLSVVSPSAAPMSLPYAAGGAVVNKGAQYLGADSDTAELAGNLAVGAAAGRGPLTRTVGRGIQKVGSLPDLPTNIPLSPKTNMLLSAMNSVKSGMGGVGRKMANYGIPQAPNVAPGPGEPPPEADLPTIRPDGAPHYNDVQDQGESNRLMDAVRGHDFIKPSDRSPVSPSGNPQYDDVSVAPGIGPDMTTTKMVHQPNQAYYHGTAAANVPSIMRKGLDPTRSSYGPDDEPEGPFSFLGHDEATAADFTPGNPEGYASPGIRGAILKVQAPGSSMRTDLGEFVRSPGHIRPDQISVHKYIGPDTMTESGPSDEPIPLPESPLTKSQPLSSTPLADSMPTPNSNTLLRAIQSAPGWPENGLPNKPWSDILNKEDFVHKHTAPESTDSDYPGRVFDQASKKFAGNEGVIQGSVKLPGDNDEITFPLGGRRTYGFTDRNFSSLDEAQATADYLNKHPGYEDARVRDHLEESGGKYHSEYPYGVEWGRRPVDESNHRTLGQSLGYSDESINDFMSWKANNELPDALSTDPYNRSPERQIQDPSYQGPERRGVFRPPDQSSGQYGGNPFHDLPPALPSASGRRIGPLSVTPSTPVRLLHGTPTSRVPSIMDEGILPDQPPSVGDSAPGTVYSVPPQKSEVGSPLDIAKGYGTGQSGYDGPVDPYSVINIDLPRRDFKIGQDPGDDMIKEARTGAIDTNNIRGVKSFNSNNQLISDQYRNVGAGRHDIVANRSVPPGLAETTAASDPTGDGQALDQARQELPNGTLSDHLQRAAQIAAQKRNTGPQQ